MNLKEQSLKKVLSFYPLAKLKRLHAAFQQGQLLRRVYSDGNGNGCLMFHLGRIRSRRQLRLSFDLADYLHVHAMIQAWDGQELTDARARQLLHEEIRRRRALHAEEARVRKAVRAALARRRSSSVA